MDEDHTIIPFDDRLNNGEISPDDPELESEEELLMTYSSDLSESLLHEGVDPLPGMHFQRHDVDENSINSINLDHEITTCRQSCSPDVPILMLPNLLDEANTIDTDSLANYSFGKEDNKKRHGTVRYLPSAPSPTQFDSNRSPKSGFFNFQEEFFEPIHLKKISSSPSNFLTRRNVGSPSSTGPGIPRGDTKESSKNPYSFQRQLSLPITNQTTSLKGKPFSSKSPHTDPHYKDVKKSIFSSHSSINISLPSAQVFRNMNIRENYMDEIRRVNTIKTDKSEEEMEEAGSGLASDYSQSEIAHSLILTLSADPRINDISILSSFDDIKPMPETKFSLQLFIYLSTFACLGTILRLFLKRLFGFDCESHAVHDWLYPLSHHICVTASGTTEQTGGALFYDLPANILGSFLMGVLSAIEPNQYPPIPWLNVNHPLQENKDFQIAMKTGFCGSLTTFSAWNTQMVVMMEGSQTILGSQPVTSLFGYLIGTLTAISSFRMGNNAAVWITHWRNPKGSKTFGDSSPPITHFIASNSICSQVLGCIRAILLGRIMIVVFLALLISLILVGDVVFGNRFYQSLWISVILSPLGAWLRWFLASKWNGIRLRPGLEWFPFGTIAANFIGSLTSILFLALQIRYFKDSSNRWEVSVLSAIRDGFAGSLSTVSTMVKEFCEISARFPYQGKAYYYCTVTIIVSMVSCLLVFSVIVRIP
jgi:fluoride exporter